MRCFLFITENFTISQSFYDIDTSFCIGVRSTSIIPFCRRQNGSRKQLRKMLGFTLPWGLVLRATRYVSMYLVLIFTATCRKISFAVMSGCQQWRRVLRTPPSFWNQKDVLQVFILQRNQNILGNHRVYRHFLYTILVFS